MSPTCLFTMGALAVLLLGMFHGFVAQTLPLRVQIETPLLAAARLQYVLLGSAILLGLAVLYQWLGATAGHLTDDVRGKVGFWLVFVGFNAAFFPTSLRRPPALLTDPAHLLSAASAPEVLFGVAMCAAGLFVCVYDLVLAHRAIRT